MTTDSPDGSRDLLDRPGVYSFNLPMGPIPSATMFAYQIPLHVCASSFPQSDPQWRVTWSSAEKCCLAIEPTSVGPMILRFKFPLANRRFLPVGVPKNKIVEVVAEHNFLEIDVDLTSASKPDLWNIKRSPQSDGMSLFIWSPQEEHQLAADTEMHSDPESTTAPPSEASNSGTAATSGS